MKLSKLRARTATRHLAGATIPRQDTTSFGMRAAMKKGGPHYAGETGEVEGKAARPRLDRPGRKAGGRVGKADGGETPYKRERAAGELDEGAQRDYLKQKAADKFKSGNAGNDWAPGSVTGLGLGTMLGAGSKIAKGIGAGVTVLGGKMIKDSADRLRDRGEAKKAGDEAKEFDKADVAEKKWGGRAKAKSKDRDGEDA